jgi:hypothetical protein
VKKIILKFLFFCSFFLPAVPVCQTQGLDYRVHAMFLYHFTKYIEWPVERNHEGFVVGFIGETPAQSEFRRVTENKKIDGKSILLKSFQVNDKSLHYSDMIYIAENKKLSPDEIKMISDNLKEHPVLIITEKKGLLQYGSMINLIVTDDKLRFQINKTLIQSRKMKVSSELLRLAEFVQ